MKSNDKLTLEADDLSPEELSFNPQGEFHISEGLESLSMQDLDPYGSSVDDIRNENKRKKEERKNRERCIQENGKSVIFKTRDLNQIYLQKQNHVKISLKTFYIQHVELVI